MATAAQSKPSIPPEQADAQLAMFARDFRKMVDRERLQARELEAANRQLQEYARDLNRAYQEERKRNRQLEKARLDTVFMLISAGRLRDEETGAHMWRLGEYSKQLALELGLDREEVDRIYWAAPLHDLGKIGVPDSVLLKKGKLTKEEWVLMQHHTTLGAQLMEGSTSPYLETARLIALSHHERWDGSGYPQGLCGEEIPLPGRIVMVADQYDALRSERPYKPPFSHRKTCAIILEGDGRSRPEHIAPQVLEAFRKTHSEFDRIFQEFSDEKVSQEGKGRGAGSLVPSQPPA